MIWVWFINRNTVVIGMKMKVMEHGPFDSLIYRGIIDSLDEIHEKYEKKVVEEKTGVTVYISPLRED